MLLALLATSVPRASLAQSAQEGLASTRYRAAVEQYRAQNYTGAIVELRAALALNDSPNTRLMLARCLRNLAQLAESATEYQQVERDIAQSAQREPRSAESYRRTLEAAQTERRQVESQVGRLALEILPAGISARVSLDGVVVPQDRIALPILANPGHVQLRVRAEGYRERTVDVEVRAASTVTATVRLELDEQPGSCECSNRIRNFCDLPAQTQGCTMTFPGGYCDPNGDGSFADGDRDRGSRGFRDECPVQSEAQDRASQPVTLSAHPASAALTGVGVGGMFAGALSGGLFAMFYVLSDGHYQRTQQSCAMGTCASGLSIARAEGESLQLATNVTFFGGIGLFSLGTVLLISGRVLAAPRATGERAPSVAVIPSPTGVSLVGSF